MGWDEAVASELNCDGQGGRGRQGRGLEHTRRRSI